MSATINELVNLDPEGLNKLTEKELRKIVSRMAQAGNKKLARLTQPKQGGVKYETAASRAVERSGGKFSVKGKNLNELRSEYKRIRGFYESKTSTRAGAEKVKQDTVNRLRDAGVDVSSDTIDPMLKIYERLKEEDPTIAERKMKYSVQNEISKILDANPDTEAAYNTMHGRLQELYEEQRGAEADFSGVSDLL